MRATGVWPQLPDNTPGNPAGYEVLLTSVADPDRVLRFPAGTWVVPPEGGYHVLLESASEVSPYPSYLSWSPEPFAGRGLAALKRIVAAGRVNVAGTCTNPKCVAWILHESSNVQTPVPYFSPPMLREIPFNIAQKAGVLMPGGRIAVATYIRASNEFTSLAVPVEVTPARTITARPESPKAGRSGLIVELLRPSMVEQRPQDDVRVALVTAGSRAEPTFVMRSHQKLIAIWRDIPSGSAELEVHSSKVRLDEKALRLRSGKIDFVSRKLLTQPKLTINIRVPQQLHAGERTLTIIDQSAQAAPIVLKPSVDTDHVEAIVSAAPLKVTLKAGPWSITQKVDVSNGADTSVTVEMHAVRIDGHVYYGDRAVPAKIVFDTTDSWDDSLAVETDAEGRYEALFVTPRTYVALVKIDGRGAPYADFAVVADHDGTCDFHLPSNTYRFRVRSKADGTVIKGAEIRVANEGNTEDKVVTNQQLITDAHGEAAAQPLRAGWMRAWANANGFTQSRIHEESVAENDERWIDLELAPVGLTDTLTILSPLGAPAAGAQVLIDPDRIDPTMLQADADGKVAIPLTAKNTAIVVKAAGAAFAARRWSGGDQTWTLQAPSVPLVIHGVHPDGKSAVHAPGALWIDGIRITGGSLAWLTSTMAGTDNAGFWLLQGLPPKPVEVLLWGNANHQVASSGNFDAMRVAIPNPWPAQVDVRVVE